MTAQTEARTVDDRLPIAATDNREVDEIDVTGWGAYKGHAIPVAVGRFIAEKISLYHANRLSSALAAKDAEIAALKKEAADVVRPFAEMPLEGTFGGPLCGAKGLYEDGSEPEYNPDRSILGREPFCAARSFLDKWEGRDG